MRANKRFLSIRGGYVAALRNISIIFVQCILILCTTAWAEETSHSPMVLDLNGCIEYAMKNSPALQVYDAQRLSKQYELDYQKTDSWPRIDLGASTGYTDRERTPILTLTGGEPVAAVGVQYWYYAASIGFRLPIFYKGVFTGVESPSVTQAKALLEEAKYSYQAVSATTIYDITVAYFTALQYKEEIKAQEERLGALQNHYNTALSKYNLDLISRSDLLLAEVELVKAEKDLTVVHNNLKISLADLANNMGLDPTAEIQIRDMPELPMILPSLNEIIDIAYQNRPDVKIQEAKIINEKAGLKLAKSEKLPTVRLMSDYTFVNDYSNPLRDFWYVALRLDMPLIDFGAVNKNIARAQADITISKKTLQQIKNDISMEAFQAYMSFQNAAIQVPAIEKHVEQAREYLKLIEEQFIQNLVPQSSVLDARAALITAQKELLQARFDQRIAYASLKKVIGQ